MTKEQKAAILEDAIDRAYIEVDQIKGVDMDTQEFRTLLKNLTDMEWLLEKATGSCYVTPESDVPTDTPKAPDPAPEPIETEAFTPAPNKNCITKDELKALLLELSAEHDELDLSDVMGQMGYEKLSDVPADRYDELLRNAKAAAGVEG